MTPAQRALLVAVIAARARKSRAVTVGAWAEAVIEERNLYALARGMTASVQTEATHV